MSYNFSGYYLKTSDYKAVADVFTDVMKEHGVAVEVLSEYRRDCVAITGFKDGFTTVCECMSSRELTDQFAEKLQIDAYTYATYETSGYRYLYTNEHNPAKKILIAFGEDYLGDIDLAELVKLAKQDPQHRIMSHQATLNDFEHEAIYLYCKYVLKIDIEHVLVNAIIPEHASTGKYLETPIYLSADFPKELHGFGRVPSSLRLAFPEKFGRTTKS